MASIIRYYFFTIDTISYWIVAALLIGGYLTFVPPTFLFVVTMISLPISLYYYKHKNNSSRFLVSLPISPATIAQSIYVFTIMMTLIVLIFQVTIMNVTSSLFNGTQYMYEWQDVISLFGFTCIALAIIIPIYHLFQSFIVATSVIGVLLFIAFYFILDAIIHVMNMKEIIIFNDLDPSLALLIKEYLSIQPYILFSIIALLILFASMKTSELLFLKRDK